MKSFKTLFIILLFSSIKLSTQAQGLFADSKCTILYYGYGSNQVFFNSKIDTNKVKIVGEGCKITYSSENLVLIFIPFSSMMKFENRETATVTIKVIEKSTDKTLDQKLFDIRRLSEYKFYIDETIENNKLILTKGLISLKSPDEANTCNLPSLTEYITEHEISIEGFEDKMKGSGTTISKKNLKTIKKIKKKNKSSEDLKLTLTITIIYPDEASKKPIQKVSVFNY